MRLLRSRDSASELGARSWASERDRSTHESYERLGNRPDQSERWGGIHSPS
jgi:hypothetical protein